MHEIRLAGPWEHLEDAATYRVTLPQALSQGTAIRRRFHSPTGLSDETRLFVAVHRTENSGMLKVTCNRHDLIEVFDEELLLFEVTMQIEQHNELVLRPAGEESAGVEAVCLRICEPRSDDTMPS